jgi:hypothetical protein
VSKSVNKKCLRCNVELEGHANRKRCMDCAALLRKKPIGYLSEEQINLLVPMLGKYMIKDMAEILKTSRANLIRYGRDNNIKLRHVKYSEELKKEVVQYFEEHGITKTKEKFKDVKVRSIVERHKRSKARQSRWTDKQVVELVKLSCFVDFKNQAKIFNRPLAFAGSITSAWSKKLKSNPTEIHGFAHNKAILFVKSSCPFFVLPFIRNTDSVSSAKRTLYLWVDMEKYLRNDCPEFIKSAIIAMAEFQRWIFSNDVHKEIIKLIELQVSMKEVYDQN